MLELHLCISNLLLKLLHFKIKTHLNVSALFALLPELRILKHQLLQLLPQLLITRLKLHNPLLLSRHTHLLNFDFLLQPCNCCFEFFFFCPLLLLLTVHLVKPKLFKGLKLTA